MTAYELWRQTYPRDQALRHLGSIYRNLGSPEKALEAARQAVRLEPNSESNYENLGNDCMSLDRLDEAEAAYKQAEERRLEGDGCLYSATSWLF